MQNQSFRVQVWASDGGESELSNGLLCAVRDAVKGSKAFALSPPATQKISLLDGEMRMYFTIPAPEVYAVNPVDESETLVVEFDNGQTHSLMGFERVSCRIDRGANGVHAVSYDHEQDYLGARRWHTTTYTVGRNGVTAIRIERGARRG